MVLAVEPVVWLIILGVVAVGSLGAWWFSPYQRTVRALRAAPRVRIADAQEGQLVRVTGVLRAHRETLVSPLAGRACAHYELLVEEHVRRGKNNYWRKLFRQSDSRDFALEDESGRAIVEADHLVVALVQDHHERSGTFDDAGPELEALLARHGHASTGALGFNRTIRYREGVLEPGETISVLAHARWEDDSEAECDLSRTDYRSSARRKRLVLHATDDTPVRASDDPKAS